MHTIKKTNLTAKMKTLNPTLIARAQESHEAVKEIFANAKKPAPLTAYRIHLADGTSYVTNMASNVTLSDAIAYFVGAPIEKSDETCVRCVRVEVA